MSNNKPTMGRPGAGPGSRFNKKKEKLKNPRETIKRLIGYLGDKKLLLVIVFFIALITTLITITGTRLNGYTIDNFIETGDMNGLATICLFLLGIYLVSGSAAYIQNRIMISIAQRTSATIRKDLFNSLSSLPLKYFDTHSSGDLMSRLTNDVDNINMTLSQSVTQFFSGIITIIGMLIAMVILSPKLTAIGLITIPIMFIVTRILVKCTQPFFIRQQKELGELNGYIEEHISGEKVVLLFSQEEKVMKEFSEINRRLTKSSIFAQGLSGIMGPVNNFINNLSYLIVAVSGGYFVINGNQLTVGVVFTFILYMRNFTRPINEILNIFNTIQSALAGAERVFEIMDEEPEKDSCIAENIDKINGDVVLDKVNFSYLKDKPILKNADINVQKGQTVAIVGPTGAGKTTIINLITKFYDIDSGNILIDGRNIEEITRASLRKNISMVLQDTFLFEDTVRENIRYGKITARDEEVEKAAKLANAHGFIKQLPHGYDTILADNGSNLSHGQRQLLAIARSVLSEAAILILDEATSSIDTRTEVQIQKAMLRLMKGKTTFVIAHRLSTIKNADIILVVNDGQIIEKGNHNELIEKDGFYAELYRMSTCCNTTVSLG